jgi:hypothetical protein
VFHTPHRIARAWPSLLGTKRTRPLSHGPLRWSAVQQANSPGATQNPGERLLELIANLTLQFDATCDTPLLHALSPRRMILKSTTAIG